MKTTLVFSFLFFSARANAKEIKGAPPAADLLAESDRSRGAAQETQGLTWTADVENLEDGNKSEITYTIKVKGNDAIAEAIAPARQKGEIILFNDRVLWFVKPGLKKPVSISPRQKLVGQTANGDIASTQYARDYEGQLVGEETLNGKAAWILELKAKGKNVTYDQIRYWISKADKLAIKAEFLTLTGEIFKSAEFKYTNNLKIGGKTYPFVSEMIITDAAKKENKSTVKYREPKETPLSSSMFNVNNLMR